MAEITPPDNTEIVALARALNARIGTLSDAAGDAVRGIDRDCRRISGNAAGGASSHELISVVIERVDAIAADCSRLSGILRGFESLAGEGGEAPATPQSPPPALPAAALLAPSASARPSPPGTVRVSEGIRLLATQMSIAGASNAEIARRLHDAFGVENSDALVTELFGSVAEPAAEPDPESESDLGSDDEPAAEPESDLGSDEEPAAEPEPDLGSDDEPEAEADVDGAEDEGEPGDEPGPSPDR